MIHTVAFPEDIHSGVYSLRVLVALESYPRFLYQTVNEVLCSIVQPQLYRNRVNRLFLTLSQTHVRIIRVKRGKSIEHCVESCSLHYNYLLSSGQCFTLTSSYELQCQEAVAVINMMVISKCFHVHSILFSTGMRSYCKRWSLCRHTTRDCTRTRARTQANTQTHARKERENARLRKEWTGYNWLSSSVCVSVCACVGGWGVGGWGCEEVACVRVRWLVYARACVNVVLALVLFHCEWGSPSAQCPWRRNVLRK